MEGTPVVMSPDGRWRWDGAAWQPTDTAQPQPRPYVSGAVRSAYVTAFLFALVLIQLVAAADRLFDASMFLSALNGGPLVSEGDYATINAATVILFAVTFVCWLCAVVAFAMWLHRVVANLPALGASRLRFTPGWAVGWFFVPLANLVVPLLVMVEAWRASDPRATSTDRSARSKLPIGLAVPIWWAVWLILVVVNVVGMFISVAYTDQEKLVLFSTGALEELAIGVGFALTIAVVRMLEDRQQRKHGMLATPLSAQAQPAAPHIDQSDGDGMLLPTVQRPTVGDVGFTYPSPPRAR